MSNSKQTNRYQVGGSLGESASTYVVRKADFQRNVISSQGNTPDSLLSSPVGCPGNPPPIPITRPELKNVMCAVAIKKLEALKASGKASSDDYLLLGYFYSLEEKYDKSQANYFTAFELTTNDAKKAIIEHELQKIDAVMPQPQ